MAAYHPSDAGAVASPEPASFPARRLPGDRSGPRSRDAPPRSPRNRLLRRYMFARIPLPCAAMTTAQPVLEAAILIADTEEEILRLVGNHDDATAGVYAMIRYHLGLDGPGAPAGKRMRPLLGLPAPASLPADSTPAP